MCQYRRIDGETSRGGDRPLTPEEFNRSIFGGEPTRDALTAPSISYGQKGIWPGEFEPDYHGVDDVAEIWWDPEAEGPDEIDKDGPACGGTSTAASATSQARSPRAHLRHSSWTAP